MSIKHIFIDTNIFLSFYHFTNEDLEELKKLSILLDRKKVILYITEQIECEFWRNRETKIADAIKKLKDQKFNFQFPQLCKGYEEYKKLRNLQQEYEKIYDKLLKKILEDVNNYNLKADQIIKDLFNKSKKIVVDNEIIDSARRRIEIGNPPGKKGSLGDAINWECLLKEVPKGTDLHIITNDKDYGSILDDDKFNEFLKREWKNKKKSNIFYYKKISLFFQIHFPDIKLATELEKEFLIGDLIKSMSFSNTHKIIAKLAKYSDFTPSQRNEIVEAAVTNNQIRWIIHNSDIYNFLKSVIDGYEDQIDPDKLRKLKKLMGLTKEESDLNFLEKFEF